MKKRMKIQLQMFERYKNRIGTQNKRMQEENKQRQKEKQNEEGNEKVSVRKIEELRTNYMKQQQNECMYLMSDKTIRANKLQ